MMMRVLLVLLAVFGLQGCLKMDLHAEILPNGMGNGTLHLKMPDQMFQTLYFMASQAGADFSFLESQSALTGMLEPFGGQIRTYQNQVDGGMRIIQVEGLFKDVRILADQGVQGDFAHLEPLPDGRYRLQLFNRAISHAFKQMDSSTIEQQIQFFSANFSGMDIQMEIKVPKLLETNMGKGPGQTVKWQFNFDRDVLGKSGMDAVTAFRELMSQKWVVFEGFQPVSK